MKLFEMIHGFYPRGFCGFVLEMRERTGWYVIN